MCSKPKIHRMTKKERLSLLVEIWISGLENQVEECLKTQNKNIKQWKSWSGKKSQEE